VLKNLKDATRETFLFSKKVTFGLWILMGQKLTDCCSALVGWSEEWKEKNKAVAASQLLYFDHAREQK
jgi:hypothetical protein